MWSDLPDCCCHCCWFELCSSNHLYQPRAFCTGCLLSLSTRLSDLNWPKLLSLGFKMIERFQQDPSVNIIIKHVTPKEAKNINITLLLQQEISPAFQPHLESSLCSGTFVCYFVKFCPAITRKFLCMIPGGEDSNYCWWLRFHGVFFQNEQSVCECVAEQTRGLQGHSSPGTAPRTAAWACGWAAGVRERRWPSPVVIYQPSNAD